MTEIANAAVMTLARDIVSAAGDVKAENVLLLDLRTLSTVADYFVICSGGSERQLKAIADRIEESLLKNHKVKPKTVSGSTSGGWVLMDYYSIVVHVFLPSQRAYYNLEALWQKAPVMLRMA